MKLATDLPLRKDKTVTATVPGGAAYTFKPDASGQTTADVDCDEHVGYLLDTGNFYPADEQDIRAGVAAVDGGTEPASPPSATETADPNAKKAAEPRGKKKAAAK